MGEPSSDASGHRARLRRRLKAAAERFSITNWSNIAPRSRFLRDTKAKAKALTARFGAIGPLLAADADTLRRSLI